MKTHRLAAALFALVLLPYTAAAAQTEWIVSSYFPADLEFPELRGVISDKELSDPAELSQVEGGQLLDDVGFERYALRAYSLSGGGTLSIEIVHLADPRASYCLLSILRQAAIAAGPPGDFYSVSATGLLFSHGSKFVRVASANDAELARRVARSVSNRIGPGGGPSPQLINHLPENGIESDSLRYFWSPRSIEARADTVGGRRLRFESDVEVAQARYSIDRQSGVLSLVSFPTVQLAEDYLEQVSMAEPDASSGNRIYARRTGPLLGILEGTFDPGTAERVLGSIRYRYSIKWIFNKHDRGSGTIWGVPVGLLGTVVRSLLLTAVLCSVSLLGGVAIAAFRLALRRYAPHNILDRPERTEMIRLKIDEN